MSRITISEHIFVHDKSQKTSSFEQMYILFWCQVNPCLLDSQKKTALSYVADGNDELKQSMKLAVDSWQKQVPDTNKNDDGRRQSASDNGTAVQEILKQEKTQGSKLKSSKCYFFRCSIINLDHVTSFRFP